MTHAHANDKVTPRRPQRWREELSPMCISGKEGARIHSSLFAVHDAPVAPLVATHLPEDPVLPLVVGREARVRIEPPSWLLHVRDDAQQLVATV